MRELLPDPIAVAETRVEVSLETLWPIEQQVVVQATMPRKQEFATTRDCARRALSTLGLPPTPIPKAQDGSPVWPRKVIGSLTHCRGYRAAAVTMEGIEVTVDEIMPRCGGEGTDTRRRMSPQGARVVSIGIDAEVVGPLKDRLLARVATTQEAEVVGRLQEHNPDIPWGRLLFSAKECMYKAWRPLTGVGLGFTQATVTMDQDGYFAATLSQDAIDQGRRALDGLTRSQGSDNDTGSPHRLCATLTGAELEELQWTGRWAVVDDLILTALLTTGG